MKQDQTVSSRVYRSFFSTIWSSDLVFPDTTIFKVDMDFIEINILTYFHKDEMKNVPSSLHKVFSNIWSCDLVLTRHD